MAPLGSRFAGMCRTYAVDGVVMAAGPGSPCGGDGAAAAVALPGVQASEGLTPQEFALFELPEQVMRSDPDVPSGGDLVF
ncbi:hypothetical protein [Mycobacterium sp. NPDC004974]